jgi:ubiquinone/menaquinone biosynthesis C-methylase UbiE
MSNQDNVASSFRNVDAAVHIEEMIRYLDVLQSTDEIQRYKNRILELVPGTNDSSALDIGCGLGDDVVRLKQKFRRAVGIDSSSRFIAEATRRHQDTGCEFHHCDATILPFKDEEFDFVRIDRSLQHMESPEKVVREMVRVVKKGGVILCAEPDWGTLFFGTPLSTLTRALQDRSAEKIRNPWIGRNLSAIMRSAGVADLSMEAHTVLTKGFESSNFAFEIVKTVAQVSAAGTNESALAAWLEQYKKADALAGLTLVICRGQKV